MRVWVRLATHTMTLTQDSMKVTQRLRGTGSRSPQLVARRNARERRRVQAVNTAFARLRRVVPLDNSRGKRVSKVKTLQRAIEYISSLLTLLQTPHTQHSAWEYRVMTPDALQYCYH